MRSPRLVAAQPPLQFVDPGQQLARQHRARVVESQVAPQARGASDPRGRIDGVGLEQTEGHEPAHEVRVSARLARQGAGLDGHGGTAENHGRGHQRSLRGSNFDTSARRWKSSRSSRLKRLGKTILTIAWRSPWLPSALGRPSPRRRRRRPHDEWAGTLRRTSPWSVGTSTVAPRAASHGATGRSTSRSRPRTRKRGCGFRRGRRERALGRAAAPPGAALAGETDALAVAAPARDRDLVVAALAERDPGLAAGGGPLERE